jgi:hypothetical protein
METRTWQEDIVSALEASGGQPVKVGTAAVVWAVASNSNPNSYYLVMAFEFEGKTLKVCSRPLHEFVDPRLAFALRFDPKAFYVWRYNVPVSAVTSYQDTKGFVYFLDLLRAVPCPGFRYRDRCRHIDATPLDSV